MAEIVSVTIHPAIGMDRLGNSPDGIDGCGMLVVSLAGGSGRKILCSPIVLPRSNLPPHRDRGAAPGRLGTATHCTGGALQG